MPQSKYRDWYVWADQASRAHAEDGVVFPGVQKSTWSFDKVAQALVLPPLLRVPARPEHRQSAGAGRDPEDHGLLDAARGVGLPHGRGAVRDRRKRRRRDEAEVAVRHAARHFANCCSGARATRSSSARPMCCPRTTWNTSARPASALQMMFNFQVNQNLFYALAAADTRPLVKALDRDRAAARHFAMGHVPAQPRRARSRPPHAEAAPARVRRVRTRDGHAALRPRHPPPPRADAHGDRPAPANSPTACC